MNARQKAKKLKKENERLKKCLDPRFNQPDIQYDRKRPEIFLMHFQLGPHMTDDRIREALLNRLIECGMMRVIHKDDNISCPEVAFTMLAFREFWKRGAE